MFVHNLPLNKKPPLLENVAFSTFDMYFSQQTFKKKKHSEKEDRLSIESAVYSDQVTLLYDVWRSTTYFCIFDQSKLPNFTNLPLSSMPINQQSSHRIQSTFSADTQSLSLFIEQMW